MISNYETNLMSSLLLYVNHEVIRKGQAFTNNSGLFYDVSDPYNNIHTHALPFQPLIADKSIKGPIIMTGVFLNNSLLFTGSSGFYDINFSRSQVFFTNPITGILSGEYSVADFNVELTNQPEETLLFETKFNLKSKVPISLSGVEPGSLTYPVIYLRNNGGNNEGFAFGGTDLTKTFVRAVILTDSQFSLDATLGIFKDLKNTPVALIPNNEFPYNAFGGLRSGVYHYDNLVSGHLANNNTAWIDDVNVAKYNLNLKTEVNVLSKEVFAGFVDLDLSTLRTPRA